MSDPDSISDLQRLASLIRARNANEVEITRMIDRPARIGHVGEYIASRIFDIALEDSAVHPGSDDRFRSGPFAGRSVNIKMHGKREGLLDINPAYVPDFHLVLTDPRATVMSSKGAPRPLSVNDVFLIRGRSSDRSAACARRQAGRSDQRRHHGVGSRPSLARFARHPGATHGGSAGLPSCFRLV